MVAPILNRMMNREKDLDWLNAILFAMNPEMFRWMNLELQKYWYAFICQGIQDNNIIIVIVRYIIYVCFA
jgi:hypothetical protein